MLHKFEQELVNKKIFITGDTGFTGSWTYLWLHSIGVQTAGFSHAPNTNPALYNSLEIPSGHTTIGDICDFETLQSAMHAFQPDLVLHLAAQPLVRRSYVAPLETIASNTMGTANVLEAARQTESVKGVLCITTDKVYKNKEWNWAYRENDELGGKDPYSASKSAAEMIIYSYAQSYPFAEGKGPAIAAARGGNIIGGGDWSEDRLIPDFVRAVTEGGDLQLRYPEAVRPWQHVLALVHGYLLILAGLGSDSPEKVTGPWNLGPQQAQKYTVKDVLEMLCDNWARPELDYMNNPLPESSMLALDSRLVQNLLGWNPVWDTETTVRKTAEWYREFYKDNSCAQKITLEQINCWREGIS